MEQYLPIQDSSGRRQQIRWRVDINSASQLQNWSRRNPQLLEIEVEEMSRILPHWILTLGRGWQIQNCPICFNTIVFDRGIRCVACNEEYVPRHGDRLAWFGMFVVGIFGLPNLRRHLAQNPISNHPVMDSQGKPHLLVPIQAFYPESWPNTPPNIHYLKDIFSLPHIRWDETSHMYHMLAKGQMCLYLSSNWNRVTMREVLITRALPHMIKLLSYCNGAHDAFLVAS